MEILDGSRLFAWFRVHRPYLNFTAYTVGTLANTTTAGGPIAGAGQSGLLNGPNGFLDHESNRVQRGAGTSDIGGPRTTEFQLKLNF